MQQSHFNLPCECFAVPYWVYVPIFVSFCMCVITHAVISSTPPFTPGEMKGFPLSQSSFFVSMVLWFCQNPIEKRHWGLEKKIKKSMSPSANSRHSLAGCRHASMLTQTCSRKERKKVGSKTWICWICNRRKLSIHFDMKKKLLPLKTIQRMN